MSDKSRPRQQCATTKWRREPENRIDTRAAFLTISKNSVLSSRPASGKHIDFLTDLTIFKNVTVFGSYTSHKYSCASLKYKRFLFQFEMTTKSL